MPEPITKERLLQGIQACNLSDRYKKLLSEMVESVHHVHEIKNDNNEDVFVIDTHDKQEENNKSITCPFSIGDTIRATKSISNGHITKGTHYEVINTLTTHVAVLNNDGFIANYSSDMFELITPNKPNQQ